MAESTLMMDTAMRSDMEDLARSTGSFRPDGTTPRVFDAIDGAGPHDVGRRLDTDPIEELRVVEAGWLLERACSSENHQTDQGGEGATGHGALIAGVACEAVDRPRRCPSLCRPVCSSLRSRTVT